MVVVWFELALFSELAVLEWCFGFDLRCRVSCDVEALLSLIAIDKTVEFALGSLPLNGVSSSLDHI